MFNFSDQNNAIKKIEELINKNKLKEIWSKRVKKVLDEKIDATSFLVWFVENYPNSISIIKNNPNYQYKFK
jgi:predicted glycosyltransferase